MDKVANRELELHIDNTQSLVNKKIAILKNLQRKFSAGTLDDSKAPKLLEYLVESALRSYAKEYGNAAEWNKFMTPQDRRDFARELATEYVREIRSGDFAREYPESVPKKYGGKGRISDQASLHPHQFVIHRHVKKQFHETLKFGLPSLASEIVLGGTVNVLSVGIREYKVLVTQHIAGTNPKRYRIADYTHYIAPLLDMRLTKAGTLKWTDAGSIDTAIHRRIAEALPNVADNLGVYRVS